MTGFESKRQAAQAKVQEEMQAVFTKRQAERDKLQDEPDMLTIVYQRGFADGKRSAQRKPLTATTIGNMMPSTIPMEHDGALMEFARVIEAKLKEKNDH